MSIVWRCLLGLALASAPVPGAAEADSVRSKAPQAQIDSFMKDCSAQLANATCWCMVKTLASTRDGDFILDILGSEQLLKTAPEAERKANALAILNRHGLKASDAQAIAKGPMDSILDQTARACA